MYPNGNVENLLKLNKLVSLENQVQAVRLQDKLGKQNFHEDMKKVFETVTKSNKHVSEEVTKTITETSNNNNKALENLDNKLLEVMTDRGMLATYLMSPLSKITNPESNSQFILIKDHNSNRVNDLLIKNTIPINLHGNMFTFRDTGNEFELKGDLLKMIANKNYNVDLANLSDKKLMYDFAKEMNFDATGLGRKSIRDRTLINLLNSPGLMISASGNSNKMFLPSDLDELCNRLNLKIQEVQAGNNFDEINDESFVILDKLSEYKCMSEKEHKHILIKCNLLHK